MSDTEKKIAEIREALDAATPGPWAVFVGEGWTEEYPRNTYVQAVWNEPDHRGSFGYRVARMAGVHGRTMADAHLIANAPEWLRFLLSQLDRKDEENRRFREERDKLIEGLRWYAQRNDVNTVSLMLSDKGQRARDILKECGVTKDA